jgi:hypothetical protein
MWRLAIAIHPTDKYAYIADANVGAVYVLDIDPLSDAYNQVTETISLPSATSGVANMELSPDGRKLFVTAPGFPNSQIIVINVDLADCPNDESANTRLWHEPIGEISVPAWVQGITIGENSQQIAFTTLSDFYGFGAVEITNDDPLGFAMSTPKYASLGLGSFADYFDINRAVDVEIMADASYAFVAAKNNSIQTNVESIDGRRAGSNIGIIKDPFGPSPTLVAATRPIPGGLTTDLELSKGDRYLWASYPGLKLDSTEQGAVLVFDVEEIVKAVENPGNFSLDSKQRGERGKVATLKLELLGDDETVYVDNVFFKSEVLKWGNPTEARNDPNFGNNFLIEKPQYSLSYNQEKNTINWVGWKLDKTWLGTVSRPNNLGFAENTIFRTGIKNFRFLQENLRKIASSKSRFYYGGFAKASFGKIAIDEHTLLNTASIPIYFAEITSLLGRTKTSNCFSHVSTTKVNIHTVISRDISTPKLCPVQNCFH